MTDESFFEESSEQSQVKSAIVSQYFAAWAGVMIGTQKRHPDNPNKKIAYIDLFAGPGRFKDGTKSTPVLVLETAVRDTDLRQRLVTLFNDNKEHNTGSLKQAIREIPNIESLKHQPQVRTNEVGEEIVKTFEQMRLIPTLFFVDPWGYKGLSLRLVNSVLKDWGCDCIFFFNYNRINMGLGNPMVRDHMNALFGQQRADELREKLTPMKPYERELTIVEEIAQALQSMGGRFVLPFCFKNDQGSRTSHHLIFITKHFKGYEIMKGIMAKESSSMTEGVPSFEYSPAQPAQQLLFELNRPLEELGDRLLRKYAGQTLKMKDIYEKHSVGTRYVKKNYKDVLTQLEEERRIKTVPPREERVRGFADHVRVTFPHIGGR